jgi:hypothetical protein
VSKFTDQDETSAQSFGETGIEAATLGFNPRGRRRGPQREPAAGALRAALSVDEGNAANGTKQTSISTLNMSAFGGKADVSDRLADVP